VAGSTLAVKRAPVDDPGGKRGSPTGLLLRPRAPDPASPDPVAYSP